MMMMGGMGGGSMSGGSMGGGSMGGGSMGGGSMSGGSMGSDQMMMDMMNKMDMMMNKMNSMMGMGGMNMGGGMNMPPMNQPMGYMDPNAMAHGAGAGAHGAGAHGATAGFGALDITSLLTGLFNFAISIFALLLVVGLIVGAVVFLKRYLIDGMTGVAPAKKMANSRSCAKCASVVNDAFNFCPVCGESKATPQPTQA